jgi:hypothetical protein
MENTTYTHTMPKGASHGWVDHQTFKGGQIESRGCTKIFDFCWIEYVYASILHFIKLTHNKSFSRSLFETLL